MNPKTLKQAIENGYTIINIYAKGSKKCRVDVLLKFSTGINRGKKFTFSFWISSKYMSKHYPSVWEKFTY